MAHKEKSEKTGKMDASKPWHIFGPQAPRTWEQTKTQRSASVRRSRLTPRLRSLRLPRMIGSMIRPSPAKRTLCLDLRNCRTYADAARSLAAAIIAQSIAAGIERRR
jgi:hypothetical protein